MRVVSETSHTERAEPTTHSTHSSEATVEEAVEQFLWRDLCLEGRSSTC